MTRPTRKEPRRPNRAMSLPVHGGFFFVQGILPGGLIPSPLGKPPQRAEGLISAPTSASQPRPAKRLAPTSASDRRRSTEYGLPLLERRSPDCHSFVRTSLPREPYSS